MFASASKNRCTRLAPPNIFSWWPSILFWRFIAGTAPQRILWPEEGVFECADYFRPTERLTGSEMRTVLEFLQRSQPSVDQGRYGFSHFLKTEGPPLLREMPFGYVVELVQLLLNKNLLSFRKGKITGMVRADCLPLMYGKDSETVRPHIGSKSTYIGWSVLVFTRPCEGRLGVQQGRSSHFTRCHPMVSLLSCHSVEDVSQRRPGAVGCEGCRVAGLLVAW